MRRILHLIMCVKTFYYLLSDHASFDLLSHEIYAKHCTGAKEF